MNYEAVYRTAPATPGLLIIFQDLKCHRLIQSIWCDVLVSVCPTKVECVLGTHRIAKFFTLFFKGGAFLVLFEGWEGLPHQFIMQGPWDGMYRYKEWNGPIVVIKEWRKKN